MNFTCGKSEDYICRANRFLAISLSQDIPKIAHLGLDSGGRSRRPFDTNLLKPGHGAIISPWAKCIPSDFKTRHSAKESVYTCKNKCYPGSMRISFHGERRIMCNFQSSRPVSGDIIEFYFATDTAPVTTWAEPLAFPPVPDPKAKAGRKSDTTVRNTYHMPVTLHFPDYGLLQLACSDAQVQCAEEFVQLPDMQGMCLGYRNTGYHNAMVAYHHGYVRIRIRATEPIKHMTLTLTVEPEVFPQLKGCDFRNSRWNGLKRCWMNSYTLEKKSLSMGDNIALGGIAHLAMHFKSDMLLFTPTLPGGQRVQNFLRRALDVSFAHAMDTTGEISWEYLDPARRGQGRRGAFMDTTPSALAAYANSFLADNNRAFGKRHAAAAAKSARFLMNMDGDGDGIIESPFHGNRLEEVPGDRTRNWWDNFAFGHKDIYFNLLCHKALRLLVLVLKRLDVQTEARTEIEEFLRRFDSAFNRVFFNPGTGVYAGWISRNGKVHDYYFTFASAMAINEGLVDKARARRVLRILLAKLREAGFGDCRYGIPGPLIPVAPSDTIDWAFMADWPRYENGGLCGQTAYHFLQALYETGMRKEADAILFKMLETFENEPTHSGLMPGYMKSVDWRMMDGRPSGYNYLADNYYFLLAAITGHYGVKLPV